MKSLLQIATLVFSMFYLGSCSSEKSGSNEDFESLSKVDTSSVISEATSELAASVIKSIPPPVELSAIIKASGAAYASEMLNDPAKSSKYATNYQKAINLGIYGADMAYINIYNQKEDALSYLNTVINLAEDLKVGQFFDFEIIKRIADNNKNLDSLLYITTSNFEKMNDYLQDQNRSTISMYMLCGGWLEALYIASNVGIKQNEVKLYEKIGEQKKVLDQILLLLSFYKNDPNAQILTSLLGELKKNYEEVKIETIYAEPTMVEENGMLVVKDNSQTSITISVSTVKKIQETVSNIRTTIID